jgi:ABC-2 type transport system permease protein
MLAAQLIINLALTLLALAILIVAGTAGFGLAAPKGPWGFTLALILTIATMFAIGLWVSAIARTTGGAGAIGQLFLYPLLFFAGLWVPRERMAPVLRHISDWSPLGASVHALQSSMQGTFPSAQPLLVLVGYAVLFGFLAVRFFRWE